MGPARSEWRILNERRKGNIRSLHDHGHVSKVSLRHWSHSVGEGARHWRTEVGMRMAHGERRRRNVRIGRSGHIWSRIVTLIIVVVALLIELSRVSSSMFVLIAKLAEILTSVFFVLLMRLCFVFFDCMLVIVLVLVLCRLKRVLDSLECRSMCA
jgi:hypothetical protein